MPTFDLGRLLDQLMREIFDESKLTKLSREKLFNKYFDYFSSAVDVGYKPSFKYYSKELAANLLTNMSQFSAFKARSFEKSLADSLINSKGRVSWSDFKKEGLKVNADYNKRWLKTEYHQTVATANMAGKWQDFERTKDSYPNLRYETVGDLRVRPKHKEWDGIVLPIDHPWWKIHYPPNDWGCRCDVTRTDDPPTKHLPEGMLKIEFKNNAAQSGKIFNKSAYEEGLTKRERKEATEISIASKLRLQRKEVKEYTLKYILNKVVSHPKIDGSITFSTKGIKEAINQNHDFILEKNELIKRIDEIIPNAKFVKTSIDSKGRPFKYHYLEININDKTSYISIRENLQNGENVFWTITDQIKKE